MAKSKISTMAVTPPTLINLLDSTTFINVPVSGNNGTLRLLSGNCYVATAPTQPPATPLSDYTLLASVGSTVQVFLEEGDLLWVLPTNQSGVSLQASFFSADNTTEVQEQIDASIAPLITDIDNNTANIATNTADILANDDSIMMLEEKTQNISADGASFLSSLDTPTPTADAQVANKIYVDTLFSTLPIGGIQWQEPVATFADLETTYPDATIGYAALVQDEGKWYLYNGTAWVNVGIPTPPVPGAQSTFDLCWPIGIQKTQAPNEADPNALFNNVDITSTWEVVVTTGEFPRFEGGNAIPFGAAVQDWAMPKMGFTWQTYFRGYKLHNSVSGSSPANLVSSVSSLSDIPAPTGTLVQEFSNSLKFDSSAAFPANTSLVELAPRYNTWRLWVRTA